MSYFYKPGTVSEQKGHDPGLQETSGSVMALMQCLNLGCMLWSPGKLIKLWKWNYTETPFLDHHFGKKAKVAQLTALEAVGKEAFSKHFPRNCKNMPFLRRSMWHHYQNFKCLYFDQWAHFWKFIFTQMEWTRLFFAVEDWKQHTKELSCHLQRIRELSRYVERSPGCTVKRKKQDWNIACVTLGFV